MHYTTHRRASRRHAQHSHAHIQRETDDWESKRSRRGRRDVSWTKSERKKKERVSEREKRDARKSYNRILPHGFSLKQLLLLLVFSSSSSFFPCEFWKGRIKKRWWRTNSQGDEGKKDWNKQEKNRRKRRKWGVMRNGNLSLRYSPFYCSALPMLAAWSSLTNFLPFSCLTTTRQAPPTSPPSSSFIHIIPSTFSPIFPPAYPLLPPSTSLADQASRQPSGVASINSHKLPTPSVHRLNCVSIANAFHIIHCLRPFPRVEICHNKVLVVFLYVITSAQVPLTMSEIRNKNGNNNKTIKAKVVPTFDSIAFIISLGWQCIRIHI